MWIAKEGLRVPLPPGWKLSEEELFYLKFSTESEWEHPCDGEWSPGTGTGCHAVLEAPL